MKLDKKIVERRIELMKAEGVEFVFNADVGRSTSADHIFSEFDAVALCCGAKKARALTAAGISELSSERDGAAVIVLLLQDSMFAVVNQSLIIYTCITYFVRKMLLII